MSGPTRGNRDQWYQDTTGEGQPDYDPNQDPSQEIRYTHNPNQQMMGDLSGEGGAGYTGQEYGETALGVAQGAAGSGAPGIASGVGDPIGGLAHLAPALGQMGGNQYLHHTLANAPNAASHSSYSAGAGIDAYTDPHSPEQIAQMQNAGAYHQTPPQLGAGSASTNSYDPATHQLTIVGHGPVHAPPSVDHPGYNTFIHPRTQEPMYFSPGNPNQLYSARASATLGSRSGGRSRR